MTVVGAALLGTAYLLLGVGLMIGVGLEEHDRHQRFGALEFVVLVAAWPLYVCAAFGYRLSRGMR